MTAQTLAPFSLQTVNGVQYQYLNLSGRRTLRTTAQLHQPRGMYCGIGVCFDCVMTIDGKPNVRSCQTPVRAGMRIESQHGDGVWRLES